MANVVVGQDLPSCTAQHSLQPHTLMHILTEFMLSTVIPLELHRLASAIPKHPQGCTEAAESVRCLLGTYEVVVKKSDYFNVK